VAYPLHSRQQPTAYILYCMHTCIPLVSRSRFGTTQQQAVEHFCGRFSEREGAKTDMKRPATAVLQFSHYSVLQTHNSLQMWQHRQQQIPRYTAAVLSRGQREVVRERKKYCTDGARTWEPPILALSFLSVCHIWRTPIPNQLSYLRLRCTSGFFYRGNEQANF